jgi:hypothetical protein
MQQVNDLPLFDTLVSKRLNKTIEIAKERGDQYGDTLKNCQWLKLRAVAKELGWTLTHVGARLLAIAGLCDVKYQRFEGGYKEDHLDDGINYDAVLAELMKEYKTSEECPF